MIFEDASASEVPLSMLAISCSSPDDSADNNAKGDDEDDDDISDDRAGVVDDDIDEGVDNNCCEDVASVPLVGTNDASLLRSSNSSALGISNVQIFVMN